MQQVKPLLTPDTHLPVVADCPGRFPAVSQGALPAGGVGHISVHVKTLPGANPEPQNLIFCKEPPGPAHLPQY